MNPYRKFAKKYLLRVLSDRKGFDISELDEEIQNEMIEELTQEVQSFCDENSSYIRYE